MIRSVRDGAEPESAAALAELCSAYWYPLYVGVRRLGHDPDEARDLTQGYFLRLMERNWLDDVRPEAGKFRSFLLASLKNYVANVRRDAAALKRGGGMVPLSLDLDSAEERYRHELADERTPDRAYDRQWALTVIERAHRALEAEWNSSGKRTHHRLLVGFLSDDDGRPYREIAGELGTTEAAVKMAVSRMRGRFGQLLRDVVGDTVDDPAEVDEEIRYLLSSLS